MKKNVLVFGLIAGLIASVVMAISMVACYNSSSYGGSMVLGYSSMLVAFSFIFVAVKNYRDKHNGGHVTFGKAFLMGLYIALIGSTMYVLTWMFIYYNYMPDFMEKYTAHMLTDAKANGATAAELAAKSQEMQGYAEMYKSWVGVFLFTYVEILPVGIIVALLCALILKRKPKDVNTVTAV